MDGYVLFFFAKVLKIPARFPQWGGKCGVEGNGNPDSFDFILVGAAE